MKKGKVGVIGLTGQSAFMKTERFPQPGETVACSSLFFEPGGKGHNQAVACAKFGVETVFISSIGDDTNGRECQKKLEQAGITAHLIRKKEPTAYAQIATDAAGENTVEVFGGAAYAMCAEDLGAPAVRKALDGCEYLLLQNELPQECLKAALRLADEMKIKVILNPAPATGLSLRKITGCTLLTPNYGEAKELAGFRQTDDVPVEVLADAFVTAGIKRAVLTLGGDGILLIQGEMYKKVPAYFAGPVVDTTGAGDTFNGTLTAALAMGEDLEQAAELAVVAAGISVTRHGAAGSVPGREAVYAAIARREV